jgi:D-glycero-D-manno-heptose 1,7-bisphosphate phosphatase
MNLQNRVVFLDRDGVINIDKGYVHKIEDFEFIDGIFELLTYLQAMGFSLIVVTNQSGIGRGYYSESDFQTLTSFMCSELKKRDINITKVYHSSSTPKQNLSCRKPNPGMLLKAKDEFDIDMANSWMVGDKVSDIEAASSAGVGNTIFVGNKEVPKATICVKSILDILKVI